MNAISACRRDKVLFIVFMYGKFQGNCTLDTLQHPPPFVVGMNGPCICEMTDEPPRYPLYKVATCG